MSRQTSSTNSWRGKSPRKQVLSRQIDLLGGIYQAGLKYKPVEGPTVQLLDPSSFMGKHPRAKYNVIKTVHLTLPKGEDSVDTRLALEEAKKMTRDGKDGMLIIRRH